MTVCDLSLEYRRHVISCHSVFLNTSLLAMERVHIQGVSRIIAPMVISAESKLNLQVPTPCPENMVVNSLFCTNDFYLFTASVERLRG